MFLFDSEIGDEFKGVVGLVYVGIEEEITALEFNRYCYVIGHCCGCVGPKFRQIIEALRISKMNKSLEKYTRIKVHSKIAKLIFGGKINALNFDSNKNCKYCINSKVCKWCFHVSKYQEPINKYIYIHNTNYQHSIIKVGCGNVKHCFKVMNDQMVECNINDLKCCIKVGIDNDWNFCCIENIGINDIYFFQSYNFKYFDDVEASFKCINGSKQFSLGAAKIFYLSINKVIYCFCNVKKVCAEEFDNWPIGCNTFVGIEENSQCNDYILDFKKLLLNSEIKWVVKLPYKLVDINDVYLSKEICIFAAEDVYDNNGAPLGNNNSFNKFEELIIKNLDNNSILPSKGIFCLEEKESQVIKTDLKRQTMEVVKSIFYSIRERDKVENINLNRLYNKYLINDIMIDPFQPKCILDQHFDEHEEISNIFDIPEWTKECVCNKYVDCMFKNNLIGFKKYFLYATRNNVTNWHMDFGCLGIYYYVARGSKIFIILEGKYGIGLRMCYYEYITNGRNCDKIIKYLKDLKKKFGINKKECNLNILHVKEGNVIFIPMNVLHAVVTPVDSISVGGNMFYEENIFDVVQCGIMHVFIHHYDGNSSLVPMLFEYIWVIIFKNIKKMEGVVKRVSNICKKNKLKNLEEYLNNNKNRKDSIYIKNFFYGLYVIICLFGCKDLGIRLWKLFVSNHEKELKLNLINNCWKVVCGDYCNWFYFCFLRMYGNLNFWYLQSNSIDIDKNIICQDVKIDEKINKIFYYCSLKEYFDHKIFGDFFSFMLNVSINNKYLNDNYEIVEFKNKNDIPWIKQDWYQDLVDKVKKKYIELY